MLDRARRAYVRLQLMMGTIARPGRETGKWGNNTPVVCSFKALRERIREFGCREAIAESGTGQAHGASTDG